MSEPPKNRLAKASQISRGVIKTVAGMAVTSPKDFVKLAAHAGDQMLKTQFSQALHDTYSFFINNGQIKQEYFDSTRFADLAPEFGQVQSADFGVEKLNVLRKIFVNLAKDNGKDSHKKHVLDIAIKINETEIKVLMAEYELGRSIGSSEEAQDLRSAHNWVNKITTVSGLQHGALVINAENGLIDEGLISNRRLSDRSGVDYQPRHGRLSSLGVELCEMMTLDDDPISSRAI
jgi:hypothetical protein